MKNGGHSNAMAGEKIGEGRKSKPLASHSAVWMGVLFDEPGSTGAKG